MRKMTTTALIAAVIASLGLAAPAAAKTISLSGPAASSGMTVDLTMKIKNGKPVSIPYFKVNNAYVYCEDPLGDFSGYEGPMEQIDPERSPVFPYKILVYKKGRISEWHAGKYPHWKIEGKAGKTSVAATFELAFPQGSFYWCTTRVVSFTAAPTP